MNEKILVTLQIKQAEASAARGTAIYNVVIIMSGLKAVTKIVECRTQSGWLTNTAGTK